MLYLLYLNVFLQPTNKKVRKLSTLSLRVKEVKNRTPNTNTKQKKKEITTGYTLCNINPDDTIRHNIGPMRSSSSVCSLTHLISSAPWLNYFICKHNTGFNTLRVVAECKKKKKKHILCITNFDFVNNDSLL